MRACRRGISEGRGRGNGSSQGQSKTGVKQGGVVLQPRTQLCVVACLVHPLRIPSSRVRCCGDAPPGPSGRWVRHTPGEPAAEGYPGGTGAAAGRAWRRAGCAAATGRRCGWHRHQSTCHPALLAVAIRVAAVRAHVQPPMQMDLIWSNCQQQHRSPHVRSAVKHPLPGRARTSPPPPKKNTTAHHA
jgi:hypothetical protein